MHHLTLHIVLKSFCSFAFNKARFLFFYLTIFGNATQCYSNVDPPPSLSQEYSTKLSLFTEHRTECSFISNLSTVLLSQLGTVKIMTSSS